MKQVTVVLGAMSRLFDQPAIASGRSVGREGKHLHIFVRHDLQPTQLDRDAKAVYGSFTIATFVVWIIGILTALLAGAIIVLFLASLDVFNQIFNKVAYKFDLPEEKLEQYYFIGILILGAVVFSFLPKIVSGDKGAGHLILRGLLNNNRRILNRLSTRIGLAISIGKVDEIHVWSPFGFTASDRELFLNSLLEKNAPIFFYIHKDELSEWTTWAATHKVTQWTIQDTSQAADANGPAEGVGAPCKTLYDLASVSKALEFIWGPRAATCFGVLLLSSSRFAAEPWASALNQHPILKRGLVSLHFANRFGDHINSALAVSSSAVENIFSTVYERANTDFGLTSYTTFYESALLLPCVQWDQPLPDGWRQLHQVINAPIKGASRKIGEDSNSLFCRIIRCSKADFVTKTYKEFMEAFIDEAQREGNHMASGIIGDICKAANVPQAAQRTASIALTREVLGGIGLKQIATLAELLEGAGRFSIAYELYEWIESIDPIASHIRKARLLERLGRSEDGVRLLLSKYRQHMEDTLARCAEDATDIDAKVPLCQAAVRYHLQWAWITISGSLEEKDADRHTASQTLEKVRAVAENPNRSILTPMDAWQLWNYLGVLAEWNKEFAQAVTFHQKAADLPGVPLRWKGASLINQGIAQRRQVVAELAVNKPGSVQLEELEAAVDAIYRGTQMKLALGDSDEAAVGLHNAAYTSLYLMHINPGEAASRRAQILEWTRQGLAILSSTGSHKKQGLLMAENMFARIGDNAVAANDADGVGNPTIQSLKKLIADGIVPKSDINDIAALFQFLFEERLEEPGQFVERTERLLAQSR